MFWELCFSDTWSSYKNLCCGIKVKEELKLDLFDKNVSIRRYVSDKTNIPVWVIHYKVGPNIVSIKINANTGEIIKKGTNPIIK